MKLKGTTIRRVLAAIGCLALLYFAAGGALLHQHTNGPDTPCHMCQVLHMPALAAASLDLVPEAQAIGRHSSLPLQAAPIDSFSLHRASRAPPAA